MQLSGFLALFGALMLIVAPQARAQTVEGHWQGAMVREGASLPVSFDFARSGAELSARFNSPTQRALGIPLRDVRAESGTVHFELVGDATTMIFDGRIEGDLLDGSFTEDEARGTFALRRTALVPPTYREEEVRFRNGEIELAGTLLLPGGGGRRPAVVFLHGSGAEGRFASRFLADHLARHGIAALIFDKRGVGQSSGDWQRSDFTALAGDAAAAVAFLAGRDDIAAERIGLYGHSQGGMIAPLVASRTDRLAFLISAAGGGLPVHEGEAHSLVSQLSARGIAGEELAAAQRFITRLVDLLRTGEGWEEFEAASAQVRGERWYPMLNVPARDNWFWSFFRGIANYDSTIFWERVRVPALVVYGERDALVPVNRSVLAIGTALNRAGNADHLILVLPRANHALNIEREPGQPFEWFRLTPGYPELLVAWIRHRVGGAGSR